MKKWILLLTVLLAVVISGQARDKDFKGVITYKIEYGDLQIPEQMRTYLPQMLKIYFRGEMSKTMMITGGGKTAKIKDGEEKTVITLIDMAGQKIAMQATQEEIQKEIAESPSYTTEFKDDTKEVAGYECKKAVLIPEDDGEWLTVYYTDELGNNVNYFDTPQYSEIPGIMLEFQMTTPQFTMTFTATEVDKKNVSSKEFDVPDEYEFKTAEELEQMFGGN